MQKAIDAANGIECERVEAEEYNSIYWKVETETPRYFADHPSALNAANESQADIHKFADIEQKESWRYCHDLSGHCETSNSCDDCPYGIDHE
jgi:hypothetical protein